MMKRESHIERNPENNSQEYTRIRWRRYLLVFMGAFLAFNIKGIDFTTGAAVLILFVIVFVAFRLIEHSIGQFPKYLPLILFCLGTLTFHFGWGENWIRRGVGQEYVAYSMLLVSFAIIGTALGARMAGEMLSARNKESILQKYDRRLYLIIGFVFLLMGWASQYWALKNHLIGFYVSAFGIDYSGYGNQFTPLILAFGQLVGVGQIVLLILLLEDYKNSKSSVGFSRQHLVLFLLLGLSFVFDGIFRFQSAAKGTILAGLVPVLTTLYVFGYQKVANVATVIGLIVFVTIIFPLGNVVRYDAGYKRQLATGSLFIPKMSYIEDLLYDNGIGISKQLPRLNQTSLLSFAIQRHDHGLPSLHGQSYWYAISTVLPRFLFPNRAEFSTPPPAYDYYTGYSVVFHGYNNWGIHTEAYLNFGVFGIFFMMVIAGFIWEGIYVKLLVFEYPIGWSIAASILLPNIFRAGEYGFLASVVTVFKPLLMVLLLTKGLIMVICLLRIDVKMIDAETQWRKLGL